MKRVCSVFLALALLCGALSGCGAREADGGGAPSVVATVFPLWDWTHALMGTELLEAARLTLLLDDGVDMHSYQPTVDDLVRISSCDLFIYVGGESDAWVEDALREAVNRDMIVVNLMDVLGGAARLEETVEGMQTRAAEDAAYDEHIWLSPRMAGLCCEAITDALIRLFPDKEQTLRQNGAVYGAALDGIDEGYRVALADRARDTLLFADRFPFRYLLDDYGLRYYAAFPGCEAETEASFETVRFLAGKVDELRLPAVLTTESPVPRLAETVVENTEHKDAAVLALDSMQAARISDGMNYLSRMETNLEILRQALN